MATIYISFPVAGISWLLFLIEKVADDIKLIKAHDQEVAE